MRHHGPRSAAVTCLGASSIAALTLLVACDREAAHAPPPEPVDFANHERQVFSQFGEDGVIEEIFRRIEPTSRYAVEFGASDGVGGSNVRNLYLNHGWSGLLIEGDPGLAEKMRQNYADLPRVQAMEAWVFPGNIETLFEDAGVPDDLDFLVIDIDSNDYWVWKVMHRFRAKVVMIEINPFFPPPRLMVIDFHPMNFWDKTHYAGASLESMIRLGREKGYEPVYLSAGLNLFFAKREYYERFGIEDNSAEALHKEPPALMRLFDHRPQGEGDVPFEKPYLEYGELRIEKKFHFDR